ncbi:hypothetical protein DFP73DRAFT_287918 [Morchella snyderi]|nr:hypothetical protein DFP73DRAFT_287918 [Morchella snyderi]
MICGGGGGADCDFFLSFLFSFSIFFFFFFPLLGGSGALAAAAGRDLGYVLSVGTVLYCMVRTYMGGKKNSKLGK